MPDFEVGMDHGKLYLQRGEYPFARFFKVDPPKGFCKNCGEKITIQIFIGGDWCSDNCRKALGKDIK